VSRGMRRVLVALPVLGVIFLLSGGVALAAFPGPNGNIAFTDRQDGDAEIYTIKSDGSGRIKLTSNVADDFAAAWSPSGKQIAFASDRAGDCTYDECVPDIYTMNSDGSDQTRLTHSGGYAPAWSPDGKQIAFTRGHGIYVVDSSGGGQTFLARGSYPTWSPDGRKIAFSDGDIYTMNADRSDVTRLTDDPGYESSPDWSPDGTRIVFDNNLDSQEDIFVMDADGSNRTNLTLDQPGGGNLPGWSPDGTRIVFSTGGSGVEKMNSDGSNRIDLTASGVGPDWGPLSAPQPATACTIKGTSTSDILHGTPGDDVICAFSGNDVISAVGGNDIVKAGAGNDLMKGGSGGDILIGGDGRDVLRGESGNDVLDGGRGRDSCKADRRDMITGCP
jgi:Ca2+-binding RTX toxin-like protein